MQLLSVITLIFNVFKLILLLALFVYFVILVLDILKRAFIKPYIKWVWLFIITFIPIIGMAAYWFVFKKDEFMNKGIKSGTEAQ